MRRRPNNSAEEQASHPATEGRDPLTSRLRGSHGHGLLTLNDAAE